MSRSPTRLLIDLAPLATPGGARGIGRYIRELARGLSELPASELDGIEVLGLASLGWNGSYKVVEDIGSFVESGKTALHATRDYYSWAYRQRLLLWQAARRVRATAVHLCDPHATPRLLRITGTKKIVTCHDIIPTRFPDHYFGPGDGGPVIGRWIERQRYTSADLVIAVSDATRNDVRTLLGVPDHRVVRVYNGVDVERWAAPPSIEAEPVLDKHGLSGRAYALYVGGSDWRKNVEGMLAAVGHVRRLGYELDLAWVGHLQPAHRERVEATAREAGAGDAFRYLGYVDDDELAILYRNALAHLFVSRLEGFGLTVVEAMASGCPVITTHAGSLAEVAGDAALTVDPEDPAAIGEALRRLIDDKSLAADLAARGIARAPMFSRQAHAKATAKVYRQFLIGA